jgi:hypothetical protein
MLIRDIVDVTAKTVEAGSALRVVFAEKVTRPVETFPFGREYCVGVQQRRLRH